MADEKIFQKPNKKRAKTGGKNFKKGQSGNPKGRPKLDPEVKAIQQFNKDEVSKLLNKYSRMTQKEMLKVYNSEKAMMIEKWTAKIFIKATVEGDYRAMDYVLNRMVGKVADKMEIEDNSTHSRIMELIKMQKEINEGN